MTRKCPDCGVSPGDPHGDGCEVALLRREVKQLEGIIERAALLLDEGDPQRLLVGAADALRGHWPASVRDELTELAANLGRVQALLDIRDSRKATEDET